MTNTKKNLLQKITEARVKLQSKKLKKTGSVNFNRTNYNYFELSDFLPEINKLTEELNLYCEFSTDEMHATLSIYNSDDVEEKPRVFKIPYILCDLLYKSITQDILNGKYEYTKLTNGDLMKLLGSSITYSRRYLYLIAFEIVENDAIDNGYFEYMQQQRYQQQINYQANISNAGLTPKFNRNEALEILHSNNVTIDKIDAWAKSKGLSIKTLEDIPDKELEELWNKFCQSTKN